MSKLGKSYLLETITSVYHDSIIPEVKLNIDELHAYFDQNGLTYKVLLDVLQEYDSNRITKRIIKDALTERANRSEEESDVIVSKIIEARKMNPDEVDNIRKRLKDICYRTFIERARVIANDDSEKYTQLISSYKYKDLGVSDFIIKDISDLDTTQLTEKYLNNPIPSSYDFINKAFAGKEGYLKCSLGIICGRPKSGKSMFLMQEALWQAKHGFKIFYLALGDLNELDFLVRMAAIDTETAIDVVYSDVEEYKSRMMVHIKEGGGSISITNLSAGKLTPEDFLTVALNRLKGKFDTIIIDYDLNFLMESDNQYARGGDLYDLLTQVKDETQALVLVATQPNKSFWNEEILDDTCFIESSKKSMIVDFAITIGKQGYSGTHLGYINIPINRRGSNPCYPYIMASSGQLVQVPESVYAIYRGDMTARSFSIKELNILCSSSD